MAIRSAQFRPGSNEVIVGGRKPYFYCYNADTGDVKKFSGEQTAIALTLMSPLGAWVMNVARRFSCNLCHGEHSFFYIVSL